MTRNPSTLTAIAFGIGLLAACGPTIVPAGSDDSGAVDTGTGLCGSKACGTGQLCCPQACSSTPACLTITTCPVAWEGACPAPDAGPPVDSGGTDSGPGPATDGGTVGDCCPVGYDMYTCNQKGGGQGLACHNPALGCASSLTCGEGCDPVVTGRCGSGSNLTWYATCGYPVCGGPPGADAGADGGVCPAVGSSCSTKGATCGVPDKANCGVTYVCDDHDPKAGGCPISSRKFKDGIQYVDDAELAALHEETLRMKLATYQYKGQYADPNPTHLGFIIEDDPGSLAVSRGFDRVDLYGYVSMVVASMQVQEKEIAALRSELDATKRRAAACGQGRK